MKMLNAYTTEIDDKEDALDELLGNFDFGALKANSVGIVSCHPDYKESDILQALAERLPFDILGCTTVFGSSAGNMGHYLLQLTVLTSDDAQFAVSYSDVLNADNYKELLADMGKSAKEKLAEDPKVGIVFVPNIGMLGGDLLVDALDDALDGVPLFGTITLGTKADFSDGATICGGLFSQDRIASLLISGNVHPRFYLQSISNKNIRPLKAVVTESDGCVVKSVNNMPYYDYMRSVGFDLNAGVDIVQFPNMVDYGGGRESVALGIYDVGDDGSVTFGGKMPEGTTFSIGVVDHDSVFETIENSIKNINADKEHIESLLICPCVTRYFMLAPKSEDETKRISEAFADTPHSLIYSGGEICPIGGDDGKLHNQLHNYSLVALAL